MIFHQKPNMYVDAVALKVTDIHRSVEFYTEVLGLKIFAREEGKVYLSADGSNPVVILEYRRGIKGKEHNRAGLYHFALLLPSRKALSTFFKHITATGYPLHGASDHLVSEAIYLSDPDGNGIEVYCDKPVSSWNWRDGMVEMASLPLDMSALLKENSGAGERFLSEGTVLGHIHLHVADLKASEHFYCELLGFQVVNRYGNDALFLSTGNYHHHIGLNTWNGNGVPPASEESAGMEHFSIVLKNNEEFHRVERVFMENNVPFIKKEQSIMVKDPSGISLLLK
ncbi:VOC family protein [Bacillus massilinigeriensis]|uniref:VOC family protein n=1 Tax=Bacillus mediterraneensis TaxID=1805474 RepID=UPI0008F92990|nr:VOC family protein [Bacillus mediterraneensis]